MNIKKEVESLALRYQQVGNVFTYCATSMGHTGLIELMDKLQNDLVLDAFDAQHTKEHCYKSAKLLAGYHKDLLTLAGQVGISVIKLTDETVKLLLDEDQADAFLNSCSEERLWSVLAWTLNEFAYMMQGFAKFLPA